MINGEDDDAVVVFGWAGRNGRKMVVVGWSLNSSPPPQDRLSEVRFNLESLP